MHRSSSRPGQLGRSLARAAAALFLLFAAAGAAEAQGAKIAVIDVGRILEDSVAGKRALDTVRSAQEQKVAQIKAKEAEAKSIQEQINAGRLTLSEERLGELEKELEDKVIELQRLQADAQRELDKIRNKALGEIEQQIMPLINQIGQESDYTLIFNKFQAGLVFAKETADITDLVLDRFNATVGGAAAEQE